MFTKISFFIHLVRLDVVPDFLRFMPASVLRNTIKWNLICPEREKGFDQSHRSRFTLAKRRRNPWDRLSINIMGKCCRCKVQKKNLCQSLRLTFPISNILESERIYRSDFYYNEIKFKKHSFVRGLLFCVRKKLPGRWKKGWTSQVRRNEQKELP